MVFAQAHPTYAVLALDQGFGTKGVSITDFQYRDDRAYAVIEQPDGKILVAGMSDNGSDTDMALARYTKEGKLDTDFNNGGQVVMDVGGQNDGAYAIALQKDGKILLAGFAENGGNDRIALARLNADGQPDLNFNGTGKVILPFGSGDSYAYSILSQDDGHVLVCGTTRSEEGTGAIVIRLQQDGSIDSGFGDKGKTIVGKGREAVANAMIVQKDGKILLAGSMNTNSGDSGAALFRLTSNGSLDGSFGKSGIATVSPESQDSALYSVAIQSETKIVFAGYAKNSSNKEILLGRIGDNGAIDPTFAENGYFISKYGQDSVAYAIAVSSTDGSILTTGYSSENGKDSIILAQFGPNGKLIDNTSQSTVSQNTSNSDKSLKIADITSSAGSLNQAGTLHDTGTTGSSEVSQSSADTDTQGLVSPQISSGESIGRALAVRKDGTVIAAGIVDNGNNSDFTLLALTSAATDSSSNDAVSTKYYSISTTEISGIKRTSAISGGTIAYLNSIDKQACESNCATKCADSTDASCFSTCDTSCFPPTITARGVCYSIVPLPVYRSSSTSSSTDSSSSSSAASSSSSSTDSSGSSSSQQTQTSSSSSFYELVRSGQTEDGFGVGSYGSDIANITPGTTYYARAYALLSDDTVVYGNQRSFSTNDACFIATAAFGSILEKHVVTLRLFRDRYLKTNRLGRAFVAAYYKLSPRFADVIARHQTLRKVVRIGLFPMVWMSSFMLYTSLQMKIFLLLSITGCIVGLLCLHTRSDLNKPKQ